MKTHTTLGRDAIAARRAQLGTDGGVPAPAPRRSPTATRRSGTAAATRRAGGRRDPDVGPPDGGGGRVRRADQPARLQGRPCRTSRRSAIIRRRPRQPLRPGRRRCLPGQRRAVPRDRRALRRQRPRPRPQGRRARWSPPACPEPPRAVECTSRACSPPRSNACTLQHKLVAGLRLRAGAGRGAGHPGPAGAAPVQPRLRAPAGRRGGGGVRGQGGEIQLERMVLALHKAGDARDDAARDGSSWRNSRRAAAGCSASPRGSCGPPSCGARTRSASTSSMRLPRAHRRHRGEAAELTRLGLRDEARVFIDGGVLRTSRGRRTG